MIVRALFTLIIIFLVYKMYQRLFRQKRCVACGKVIFREAAICHHCNTIQEDVELVQVKIESAQAACGKQGGQRVMATFIGAVMLIVLGVVLAVWLIQPG